MHSIARVQSGNGIPCTSNPIVCGLTPCLNLPAFELRDFSHNVRWLTPRLGFNYVQLNLHKPAVIHSMNIILKGEVQVMKELCVLSSLNESRKISRGVSWSLSLMGLFLTGCLFPDLEPCYGLELGDELLIEVGELDDAPDLSTWEPVICPDYDVVPGTTVTAQVEHFVEGDICLPATGEISFSDDISVEINAYQGGGGIFRGQYRYFDERTSCSGELRVYASVNLSSREALERGEKYDGKVRFKFLGGGKCPPGCEGWFRAQVSLK